MQETKLTCYLQLDFEYLSWDITFMEAWDAVVGDLMIRRYCDFNIV